MDLTVLIITKNAAETLGCTLESIIPLTTKIVVVDGYSTDDTIEIAQKYNCRIVRQRCYDFGEQRAFALTQVASKWTLILDSDEVLTEKNREEITKAVSDNGYDGYDLFFRNHLFGKKLLHGELHKKCVLFKTKKAFSRQKYIHEQYEVNGKIGRLPSEVLHFSYRSILQIASKFFDYSIRQAKQYKKEKKHYGVKELFMYPLHMFYARFIGDQGYKDRFSRIFLDAAFAKMEFLSYALIPFVKEKRRISVDCGPYKVGGEVRSGIDRVIQGVYVERDNRMDYYWFGFHRHSPHKLFTRFYSTVWLPVMTVINRCDVFLGTGGTIPWMLQFFPVKKILFLYDFGFFSSPDKYDRSAEKLQRQTNVSLRLADRIVVLHEEIYREFLKRYPEYGYKAVVIPSGADHLEKVQEKPVFIQEKKPLVLFVGVVKPVKRIDIILSAIENAYCVIAGPQEKKYAATLKIGKSQNVQFIWNFNDGQLKWLYKNADVMLYASEHEGFCYPVLEALISGLPVIAFDLPVFRTYQRFFPHLTLVETEEEMKSEFKKISAVKRLDKYKSDGDHPYKWKAFGEKLAALCQTTTWPEARNHKVGFIVVLYKTSLEEKNRLMQEIEKLNVPSYEIYWIDNTKNNKGYAAGVNEGIVRGLNDFCDYFIALNPDISLTALDKESWMSASKMFDVWGYGMQQGKYTFYGGEIDKWRMSGGLIREKPAVRFASVDFVTGSLIGFSKEVVQTIGLWSEKYGMYYEDVDYCVRARAAGFQVGIDAGELYEHYELSQTNKKKEKWLAKSRWLFFWSYATIWQKIREALRLPKTMTE